MAKELFANNIKTTLSSTLAAGATTITVSSDSGFPTVPTSPSTGDYFYLTLFDLSGAVEQNIEIVKVVSKIAANVYTIVRGQDGTTDINHNTPATTYYAALRLTSGKVSTDGASGFLQAKDNLASITNAATARTSIGLGSTITGSGNTVLATSPTLTTPTLGVASATSVNKVTITAPATGSTLTVNDGKTLVVSNSLTLAGTDSTTMTFPSTNATIARTDAANTFTGTQTFSGAQVLSNATAVTAGTNAQGQGALTADVNVVTTAASNPSGVTLPTAAAGRKVVIVNKGANAVSVYPASGGQIDALGTNVAISLAVGGWMEFEGASATQWYSTANVVTTLSYMNGLAAGVATFLATPTSANLAAAVTDENGSGGTLVFSTSPTLTTPALGVATATSVNKVAFTAPATGSTLTIADGKTLTANNSLTLSGTDATTMTFPSTSATLARTDAANTFTGTQTYSGAIINSNSTAVTAGTNAQGQGALTTDVNLITTAANNPSGVTLPTAAAGRKIVVINKGANAVNIYPATGGAIDALGANVAISLPVNGWMEFSGTSATQWYSASTEPVALSAITGFGTNVATFLATPSSANLAAAVTDETGTAGTLVFSNGPTLTTPTLGVASATSINKVAITAPATSATITIPDGVTLTGPAASGTAMTLGNTETVTGVKTFGSAGAVGRLKIAGTTSGAVTLDAPAVAGTAVLTLPGVTSTLVYETSTTGSVVLPASTTANRDGSPAVGYLRYNTDLSQFEGYGSAGWGKVGGGASGGGTDAVMYENDAVVSQNVTIGSTGFVSGVGFTNASATITLSGHAFVVGSQVWFTTTGTLPTNFSSLTRYYVVSIVAGTSFTVAATDGGTAIVAGSAGSGTHSVGKVKNASSGGPMVVASGATVTVPDGAVWTIS